MSSQDGSPKSGSNKSLMRLMNKNTTAPLSFRPGNASPTVGQTTLFENRPFPMAVRFKRAMICWPQAGSGNITAQLDDLEAQVMQTIKSEVAALSKELHHKLDQLVAAQAGGVMADGRGTGAGASAVSAPSTRVEGDADRLDAELVDAGLVPPESANGRARLLPGEPMPSPTTEFRMP